MKFLFIQRSAFPLEGVMSLSAVIKNAGWEVDLVLAQEENIFQKVANWKPDVIGFTVFTTDYQWICDQCQKLKKIFPKAFIVLGGPHPTYYPQIIKEAGVDAIVRGEGEKTILDLLDRLSSSKSTGRIRKIWGFRPLINNLDKLPFPDREIYYKYGFLKNASVKQFLTGRGCPYACSFCSNHLLRKLYKGKGKYLRRIGPEKMIAEIKEVEVRYGFKVISFTDDVFISDKKWLRKFLPLYKKEINVPFMCNVTANSLNEDIARMLEKAGCYGVAMGIESGSQEIRFRILNKFISDRQIIKSAKIAKRYKFSLKTYNILSLPGETLEDAISTVKLNAFIKPDSASASLLQPFPNYDITKYAIAKGNLPKNFGVADVGKSIYLSSPIISGESNQIENLQALFPFLVAHPKFIPLVKPFLKIEAKPLSRLLARLTYGYYLSRVHKLSFWDKLRYLRHLDPLNV